VRPWRWRLPPAVLEGLLPGLVAQAVTHAPIQSWLAALVQAAPKPGASTLDVPLPEVPMPDAPPPDAPPPDAPPPDAPPPDRPPQDGPRPGGP
jgi:hypothetical protein